jgi:hypothetical protein
MNHEQQRHCGELMTEASHWFRMQHRPDDGLQRAPRWQGLRELRREDRRIGDQGVDLGLFAIAAFVLAGTIA